MDPEIAKQIGQLRARMREGFGKVVLAMMAQARYRHQSLSDLQHLVLEPLMRDRIAIAYPGKADAQVTSDITGLAFWASVSEEVDAKIREQIKTGTWPLRLKPDDWASGQITWLIDVIAADQKATARVIGNFRQVVKESDVRLHPIIARLLDQKTLEDIGAVQSSQSKEAEQR